MKKLALLTLCLLVISGCKKEEPKPQPDPNIQDFTSCIFWHDTAGVTLPNCVIGYFSADGLCHKLAEIGNLEPYKQSIEVPVSENISEIYLFTDYYGPTKLDKKFQLKRYYKNIFFIEGNTLGLPANKDNPYEYPH